MIRGFAFSHEKQKYQYSWTASNCSDQERFAKIIPVLPINGVLEERIGVLAIVVWQYCTAGRTRMFEQAFSLGVFQVCISNIQW